MLSQETVQSLANVWVAGLLVLVVLCVTALFVRYRRANEAERKQIKWLLYVCAVFLIVYVGGAVSGLGDSTSVAGYLWHLCCGLSLASLPAAIGIAVLRYRLYDIDVIIRCTLIYSILTALLAVIYVGSLIVLQPLLRPPGWHGNRTRDGCLNAGDRGPLPAVASPYSKRDRPALLPTEVRCAADIASI